MGAARALARAFSVEADLTPRQYERKVIICAQDNTDTNWSSQRPQPGNSTSRRRFHKLFPSHIKQLSVLYLASKVHKVMITQIDNECIELCGAGRAFRSHLDHSKAMTL